MKQRIAMTLTRSLQSPNTIDMEKKMKALWAFVLCVVFVIANGFIGNANANFKWDYFLLGTLGVHTLDGNAFTGLTGYVGGGETNKGFGVLGSYEVGSVDSYGYDVRIQLINVYLTGSYKIRKSTILLSYGVSESDCFCRRRRRKIGKKRRRYGDHIYL